MGSQSAPLEFQKAKIYEIDRNSKGRGSKHEKGLEVPCMFNPYEYKVTKSNNFDGAGKNGKDAPQIKFTSAGSQTLTLSLIFDTYEDFESDGEKRVDVSQKTRDLWQLMKSKKQKTGKKIKFEPPEIAFEWGVFQFRAFITNMTQTFTLFDVDGTPLRAKVDVTFTQYTDVDDYPKQEQVKNGTTYERAWDVVAGDRLDTIADEVYSDPGQWRRIAEYNRIVDPLSLSPGQRLRIPLD